MKTPNKVLTIILIGLFLGSCAAKNRQHLGCTWQLPYHMTEVQSGVYSSAQSSFFKVRFYDFGYQPPESDIILLVDVFEDGGLVVNKYQANDFVNFYVISRIGHVGSVTVFDEDYQNFLVICDRSMGSESFDF